MAINQKLTKVIEERVVKSCQEGSCEVEIRFQDGSVMTVKVMESDSPPLREGLQVCRVHENGTELIGTRSTRLFAPGAISVNVEDIRWSRRLEGRNIHKKSNPVCSSIISSPH